MFPHRYIDGKVLMDGGTVWNTNFETPILECLKMVDSPSKVSVDIAICQTENMTELNATKDTIGNVLRWHEIRSYYKGLDDIIEFSEANPLINYRYFFMPSDPIPGGPAMLNFGHEKTEPYFE